MTQFQHFIRAELDPSRPVPEICGVITALAGGHPQEAAILRGVADAITRRLEELEKEEKGNAKPILQPGRNQQNQG